MWGEQVRFGNRVDATNRRDRPEFGAEILASRAHFAGATPNLDLSDGEADALVRHLRRAIDTEPYPLSPRRLVPLRAILDKLEPPKPRPELPPPLGAYDAPSAGRR
jgi:hypothetical protein